MEYICPDCGVLLMHKNPVTLESMKDVHSQLCVVKRQTLIAVQGIKLPTAAAQKPLMAEVQRAVATPVQERASTPLMPSSTMAAATTLGADTTISLTGTGKHY